MNNYPTYSVAIRTLGTAGEKYLETLRSVDRQSVQPENIFVYIPHGYALPNETIGKEVYIRCEKGMITQRSLSFSEINSEFILFLDDDLSFEKDMVKKMFDSLLLHQADCISPNIYPNHNETFINKCRDFLGGTHPHYKKDWAFIIRNDSHYSYNNNPKAPALQTQSGAGACALCRKTTYEAIHFEDERWMEDVGYAYGDDQLFFYKMHKYGHKVLTAFDVDITHLDAGAGGAKSKNIGVTISFCRYVIWRRTIFDTKCNSFDRFKCRAALLLSELVIFPLTCAIAIRYRSLQAFKQAKAGKKAAKRFIKSEDYKKYPSFLQHIKQ
ncbi:MAG: glycosyltransferase [Bacteroidales bacterium]|nr:glycosyltransferase [Bacteroidales bacterium]